MELPNSNYFMMELWHRDVFCITGHLREESTVSQGDYPHEGQNCVALAVFFVVTQNKPLNINSPAIWDVVLLMGRHCIAEAIRQSYLRRVNRIILLLKCLCPDKLPCNSLRMFVIDIKPLITKTNRKCWRLPKIPKTEFATFIKWDLCQQLINIPSVTAWSNFAPHHKPRSVPFNFWTSCIYWLLWLFTNKKGQHSFLGHSASSFTRYLSSGGGY